MIAVVKEILGVDDIVLSRGPKKGSHRKSKVETSGEILYPIACSSESEVIEVMEEIVNPLSYFEAQDLVAELRNRGYAVTCKREVITIETLWSQDIYIAVGTHHLGTNSNNLNNSNL